MTTVVVSSTPPPVVQVVSSSTSSNPSTVGISGGAAEAIEPYQWGYGGVLLPVNGGGDLYLEGPYNLASLRFTLETPSIAGAVVLDLNCNGTSIFASPVQLAANQTTLAATSLATKTSFTTGDVLSVDIIDPGLSQTAADLTVTLRLKRLF